MIMLSMGVINVANGHSPAVSMILEQFCDCASVLVHTRTRAHI